jgi:hypothetical protein
VTEPTPPSADDLELHEVGELMMGYDWLAMACNVIQTLALIIIAVALVVRL